MLGTGGYGNVFYLSTNAKGSNATAIWRAHKRGALFANPCFTQIHPTCIPRRGDYQSKLTLMSESLRNDGRIWVPQERATSVAADQIPEDERDYYLERRYPSFGNLVPRDVASRDAKEVCDEGRGVGRERPRRLPRFRRRHQAPGRNSDRERYGNLFDMYERITGEDPYKVPMRIYPGHPLHDGRPVGGLQLDEHDSRAVRDRRSEFLRSRRQPPGRQRADAGPGRRLLRPALHHRRLPGDDQARARSTPTIAEFARRRSRRRGSASTSCSRSTASAPSIRSIASSAR